MKVFCALALCVLALGGSAVAASGSPSSGGASGPHYVFSFSQGLNSARLGASTNGYKALFRKAIQLPNIGSGICYGLAWAVSPDAQKAHKPDVELYCGEKPRIYEVHFASGAFCSSGGACIGAPGSLKKFAAELSSHAEAVQGMDCLSGSGKCTSLYGIFDLTNVEVTSANCPRYASLAAIGAQCVASTVLIYREAPQHLSP
jgi:hypothetical protein